MRIGRPVRVTLGDFATTRLSACKRKAWALQGRAVLPNIDLRHLYAAIVLAEEMNFTRASHRLHITQPALSKRINEVEELQGVHLFARDKGRSVELTDAGRAFVEEARVALFHVERAIHVARASNCGPDARLVVGYSPDADPSWISAILATQLPFYPQLRVRLRTGFAMDLVRDLLVGAISLALVTAPPEESQITAVPFARAPLSAILHRSHRYADREQLRLRDLAEDDWILSARQVHPTIHEAIFEQARREGIPPKDAHDTFTEQQAVQLVTEHAGVAILTKASDPGFRVDGVVVRPILDHSLCFDTCLVLRSDDDSKLGNTFARSFLRRFPRCVSAPNQSDAP